MSKYNQVCSRLNQPSFEKTYDKTAFRENAFRDWPVGFVHLQPGVAGLLHPVVPTPAIGRNG